MNLLSFAQWAAPIVVGSSAYAPIVTSGGQQTVFLRALKYGRAQPPLVDLGDESIYWFEPLAAAAHRFRVSSWDQICSYIADAIWDVLHHASAVVLHRDHGDSFTL